MWVNLIMQVASYVALRPGSHGANLTEHPDFCISKETHKGCTHLRKVFWKVIITGTCVDMNRKSMGSVMSSCEFAVPRILVSSQRELLLTLITPLATFSATILLGFHFRPLLVSTFLLWSQGSCPASRVEFHSLLDTHQVPGRRRSLFLRRLWMESSGQEPFYPVLRVWYMTWACCCFHNPGEGDSLACSQD